MLDNLTYISSTCKDRMVLSYINNKERILAMERPDVTPEQKAEFEASMQQAAQSIGKVFKDVGDAIEAEQRKQTLYTVATYTGVGILGGLIGAGITYLCMKD